MQPIQGILHSGLYLKKSIVDKINGVLESFGSSGQN